MLCNLVRLKPEILIRLQIVGLGCFCNAVENRTGLCSSGSVEHHPILAPNCKGADSSLTGLFLYADKQRLLDILCGHTLHSLLLAVTVDVS